MDTTSPKPTPNFDQTPDLLLKEAVRLTLRYVMRCDWAGDSEDEADAHPDSWNSLYARLEWLMSDYVDIYCNEAPCELMIACAIAETIAKVPAIRTAVAAYNYDNNDDTLSFAAFKEPPEYLVQKGYLRQAETRGGEPVFRLTEEGLKALKQRFLRENFQ
jgi:hypothetical protein